mmetsp:Transcript_32313/g.65515  ORF Transcript_32313/g.65515 Transcript_32313/m.65515 type:complete len:205 (+) Transcript_32313:408-1022(+)
MMLLPILTVHPPHAVAVVGFVVEEAREEHVGGHQEIVGARGDRRNRRRRVVRTGSTVWAHLFMHADHQVDHLLHHRQAALAQTRKVLDDALALLRFANIVGTEGRQAAVTARVELLDEVCSKRCHVFAGLAQLVDVSVEAHDDLFHVRHVIDPEGAEAHELPLADWRVRHGVWGGAWCWMGTVPSMTVRGAPRPISLGCRLAKA